MFDLKHLDSLTHGQPQRRFDALPVSEFVEQELLQISQRNYERRYPELRAKELIPIDNDISPGATEWGYDEMDHRGQAKFFGGRATDIPRIGTARQRHTFPVSMFWLAYDWTVVEILNARQAGRNLPEAKAAAVRREMAVFENTVLLMGDAGQNIPGLLNNPAVPLVTVPNGNWLGGANSTQVAQDVAAIVDRPWLGTLRAHRPNTMAFPPSLFRALETMAMANTATTVLEFLRRTNPAITAWELLDELETAGTNGGRRILAYQRDPDLVTGVVPQPYTELPPQTTGIEVLVPAWQSIGGAVFRYPRSAVYAEGM